MMRPDEKKTTTESIELYKQSLEGNNYSRESIKAYLSDLAQFVEWLKSRRVDFDIPYRIARIDIVEFINHLATKKSSSVPETKAGSDSGVSQVLQRQPDHLWQPGRH